MEWLSEVVKSIFLDKEEKSPIPDSSTHKPYPVIKHSDIKIQRKFDHEVTSVVKFGQWNNEQVAVKYFKDNYFGDTITNEIDIVSQFHGQPHDNILTYHGHGTRFGKPFNVLCYAENGALTEYLDNYREQLDMAKKLNICCSIFAGIEFLHQRRIIHNDINPANILLDENHTIKICDFGLSVKLPEGKDSAESNYASFGEDYVSPELLKEQLKFYLYQLQILTNQYADTLRPKLTFTVSKQTDLYMLGITTFEVCVNENPYPQNTSNKETDHQKKVTSKIAFIETVIEGTRPVSTDIKLSGPLNSLIKKLWSERALDRPSVTEGRKILDNELAELTSESEQENSNNNNNFYFY